MRAVIIDPWNQTIYATDKPSWGLDEMYQTLSGPDGFRPCADADYVELGRNQVLWVDVEGLLIPNVPVFELRGYPRMLAGKGLLLGLDEEGETVGTHFEVDWVQSMIRWSTSVTTGELCPSSSPQPNILVIGEPILKEKGE